MSGPDAVTVSMKGKSFVDSGRVTEVDQETGEILVHGSIGEVYNITPRHIYGSPAPGDEGLIYHYGGNASHIYIWLPEGFRKLTALAKQTEARPKERNGNGHSAPPATARRDREIDALEGCIGLLAPLAEPGRRRVIAFLASRYDT